MTPERWQKIRPILESALELDAARRPEFLDSACPDPSLRNEVESLIASHEQAGTDVLNPASSPTLNLDEETQFRLPPGKRIGAYEILEEIAVGGMGAVYRAVRADGQYKQQVALKIVRSELGAEFTTSRFKNERQILASLNHPNIAKILDGGTTTEGVPYFVMELVEGQRIDKYCDGHKLTTTERLNLFLEICSAVQYAHQHLIIHRDIKPGNIVVNAEMVPKLLDFGIAKILESSEASNQPEQTISLVRLLTPEYASPEQIKGEPITTASDVYSLGVVLYELLTGCAAYSVPTHTPHEISRAVCETEPERPSMAVLRKPLPANEGQRESGDDSPLTATREGSPEKLSKRLRGDLDNIVLMALRKEPQRRYGSVEQFAQDIRRHLEHLPVIARQDTFGYRASKFIIRHKVGVAAAVLVTLALLSATGITIRQARIARAERARAERRFNDVRKLANSLMFEVHDSIQELPGATAARKLIIQRAQEYLDGLAQESQSDPALLRELAAAYGRLASVQGHPRDANLGDTPKALQNSRKAVELLEAALSLNPSNRDIRRELAESKTNLSYIQASVGDQNGSKRSLDEAVRSLEELVASNPEDLVVESDLGEAYSGIGFHFNDKNDFAQGLTYHQKALAIYQRIAKADPRNEQYQTQLSFSHKRVASVLIVQNQLPVALEHEQAALAIDEAQLALHPDNARTRYNITFAYGDTGFILWRQRDLDGALSYYRKALAIRAALVAADPQDTRARNGLATTYYQIGGILEEKADLQGALDSYKRALALIETLSQADPTNESHRVKLADTQVAIADLYANMAFKSHLPSTELEDCREAANWFRRGLPFYLQRKAQGKQGYDEDRALVEGVQNREKCAQTIARLDHTAVPSPQ
jgi:non-specific serine/threonine protein kinase/serine/threonine-protein kinase